MGFLAPAAPYIVGGTALLGIQQAGQLGKYNQSVANRNADIKEQSNQILDSKLDLDLARFDQELKKLISSQKVTTAASGAVIGTGTAKKIELSTLYKAEVDKDIANYNNEIAKARNLEAANLDRIQGQLARQRAKLQQFQIATQAGTSLLTMTG
jgi:hypothetical protein|tara:strand:- start:5526 stop:5987 length:462 start_codon:yes stop_codon:yes gene_type:complete